MTDGCMRNILKCQIHETTYESRLSALEYQYECVENEPVEDISIMFTQYFQLLAMCTESSLTKQTLLE